jgi:m7GpppX diphosphatase
VHSAPLTHICRVYNILAGKKEAERVLYKDDDPDHGFMILPDLKWDQTSMSALVSGP